MKSLLFMALTMLAVNTAFAEATIVPQETDELRVGEYKTPSGSYLSDLKIEEWAGDFIVLGKAIYGNTYPNFEGKLSLSNGVYTGAGDMTVNYTNGLSCSYPMEFVARAKGNELYLKTRGPTHIYTRIRAKTYDCPAAPATGVTVIKKPYVLIED